MEELDGLLCVEQTFNLVDLHSPIYLQSGNWLHAFVCFEVHGLATIFKVHCVWEGYNVTAGQSLGELTLQDSRKPFILLGQVSFHCNFLGALLQAKPSVG